MPNPALDIGPVLGMTPSVRRVNAMFQHNIGKSPPLIVKSSNYHKVPSEKLVMVKILEGLVFNKPNDWIMTIPDTEMVVTVV